MQRCIDSGLWVADAKSAGLTPASEALQKELDEKQEQEQGVEMASFPTTPEDEKEDSAEHYEDVDWQPFRSHWLTYTLSLFVYQLTPGSVYCMAHYIHAHTHTHAHAHTHTRTHARTHTHSFALPFHCVDLILGTACFCVHWLWLVVAMHWTGGKLQCTMFIPT